jgi:hypothetical protein
MIWRERLSNLVAQWKARGASIDTFHATMGIGYKACAEDLSALLTALEGAEPPATPTLEQAFGDFYRELNRQSVTLPIEAADVLRKNLWDLYERDPAPAAAREGAEPERPQPERVDIDYRGYSFKMPFSERPQPTCATCRHSQVMRSPMPDLDAWPLVCANGVRIKPDDPGLTMPVYGRRVPDDFGCSMHEPKPEPVAHAQTPERP